MGEAAGPPHRLAWAGAGIDSVTARLRCAAIVQCGEGPDAFVALRRISLTLDDAVSPTIDLGGPLFAPGSRRGDQAIDPIARDKGSGVHRIVVEVNGEPILGRGVSCELAGHVALQLRPCPARSSPSLSAATSAAPFVQGPNEVRVCALDYAPDTTANRACREREVRVDNECPISDATSGAQLVAAIDGADRARVGPREGATVEGRLLDAQGAGVAGARVCVATRVTLDGRREIVTASPATKPDGSFSVALPAGPSREVRVAYWPDAGGAIERFLTLQARADPRLRLRPRHRLHNGDRVRFGVRIPDPANAGRDVRLKVRSEGRWQVLRSGHTDGDGRWRTGYRFHATTGRRRYAFRAVVPAQNGYPYATGRSAIRHQTVIGG